MSVMPLLIARRCLHWAIVPGIAIVVTLWPTLSTGLERLQTDPGDTLLNLYFLEHAFQHFAGLNILQPEKYWSPNFFWPIQGTLAWSDHLLGESVLYGLFRPVLDQFHSYIAWLSLTLWLNYISIRSATQHIAPKAKNTWLSIVALVTAFSPAILQQLGHPQLLSLFLTGPILIYCHRLIHEPVDQFSIRDWLILGCWLLANGFFNIYIFVYACYGSLICALIHLARRFRTRNFSIHRGQKLMQIVAAFTTIVALNLAIYIPYLKTLSTFGKRPYDEILNNLPKPGSWLYSSQHWLLPGPFTPDNVNPNWIYGAEQELFPGWGFLILFIAAIITAWKLRQSNRDGLIIWLGVVALMGLLSLSIDSASAWPLISKLLPGASSLRASSRVGMMIILFAAPALTLASQHWHRKIGSAPKACASLLALGGGFAGIWSINQPSFSLSNWKREASALSTALKQSNCSAFWYQWSDQAPWRAHVLAMHVQGSTGVPTANGYSGHFPREDWPFTNPSGRGAFEWIKNNSVSDHHNTRRLTPEATWCVATLDSNLEVSLNSPNERLIAKTRKVRNTIFENQAVSIGAKQNNLYFRLKNKERSDDWILITRNNYPISANRGDFHIVSAKHSKDRHRNELMITDLNPVQGIEYVWTVDAQTGEFLGQMMNTLPRP